MLNEVLRVTSAGSVDDGKSTILARLLLDTGSIYDDQLSKNYDPNKIADLLDGLESEQSQGITIDVAHRFFDSNNRRYQIADSPGHEQYTRNMATACAGSDALLLVVDAQTGLKAQTKHHLEIGLRLGIKEIVFAINKMDLVNFSEKRFRTISNSIEEYLEERAAHFPGIAKSVIPVSGLTGYNVVRSSKRFSWYEGKTLLGTLDALQPPKQELSKSLVNIQMTQRLSGGGRRYLARILSGQIRKGQTLHAGKREVSVSELMHAGEKHGSCKAGSSISLELDQELDIGRGQVLSSEELSSHEQFEVDLIWLSEEKGRKGRKYILNAVSSEVKMSITKISSIDLMKNAKQGEKSTIETNEIVRANIALSEPLWLQPFSDNFSLGRFTMISAETGQTVAVGLVKHSLRRSANIQKQNFRLSIENRAELTGNTPRVIWFTGLSGSGKSTIADELSMELYKQHKPHYVLDGDNLRFGLNYDLGFIETDRTENIRRTAEVAKLMADAGLIVLVTLISPNEADRNMAKEIIGEDKFTLVYIDTPIDVCETRDPKGLYKKARAGKIPNFTGIGSEFESPLNPDFVLSQFSSNRELIDKFL